MSDNAKFEITTTSRYLWAGTVLPDVKDSTKYGMVIYIKPAPSGEGLGAESAKLIASRLVELCVEHKKSLDPFTVWLDGPFVAPEGSVLKKGGSSLYHDGAIPGAALANLIEQADKISLVKGRYYGKPTLKLTKGGGAKKGKEEKPVKPQLSW